MFTALVRDPQPNRVELILTGAKGPLVSKVYGKFDPSRFLQVYNDGAPVDIVSHVWDGVGNRYILFLSRDIDTSAVTQIIHHMPNPPFVATANPTIHNRSLGSTPSISEVMS